MRRRSYLLLLFCLVVAFVGGTYVILVYTGASRSLVESVMSQFIRSRFVLDDAKVDPATGTVRLAGVQIGHPTLGETDVLVADHIEFDVNTNPLASAEIGSVRRIAIQKLHLHLSFTNVEQWNLWEILMLPEGGLGESTGSYPAVTITDSVVSVRLTEDRPAAQFTNVNLELAPETVGSSHMVLSGSMRTPEGFDVRVRGSGDPSKGEFQALFDAENLPLRPRIARPYSPAAERYLEQAKLSGDAKKVALWVQYPPHPEDDHGVSAQITVDVEDVGWKLPNLPYPIAGASGKVTAATREGGKVYFDLLAEDDDQSIRTRGELTQCLTQPLVSLLVESSGIPVDDVLGEAVTNVRGARTTWNAFAPAGGAVDADMFVYNNEPGGQLTLSLDMNLRGVSGKFVGFPRGDHSPVGFPYQVDNLNGLVQLRHDRVEFEDVTGTRPDGARIRMHGSIIRVHGQIDELVLEVEAESVVFSEELRAAIAEVSKDGGDIYKEFAPRGSGDMHVVVRKPAGVEKMNFAIEIHPLDASAIYEAFPYPLDGIGGRIFIDQTGATFDLSGSHDAAAVQLGGRYFFEPSDGPQCEVWLEGSELPLDDVLRRTLQVAIPDLEPFWQQFDPTGVVDCKLTLWRPTQNDTFSHDVRLDCRDTSVAVEEFGLRLDRLGGSVFVHGTGPRNQVDFSGLRGEIGNGPGRPPAGVFVEGSLQTNEADHGIDLTTIIRSLELNPQLADALNRADVLRKAEWSVLQPSGVVDLVSHKTKELSSAEPTHHVRVQLQNVVSNAPVLPTPVTALQGELTLHDGVGEFEQIRGMFGKSLVVGSGKFRREGSDTVVQVTLSADELSVDSSFAALMTGPMSGVLLDRGVRGTLGIHDFAMDYRFPDVGDDFELEFGGTVIANQLNLNLGAPVDGINGTFEFTSGRVNANGGNVKCAAKNVSFRVLGHQATNFAADLTANPDEISIDNLQMKLHGGMLLDGDTERPALVYDIARNELSSALQWSGMSLTQFMRAIGEMAPVSRGTVSGTLDVNRLSGDRLEDMEARAHLNIANGRLGEVPIFTAIYAYLSPSKRPQFDSLSVDLRVDRQELWVDDLRLTSPLVDVAGKGTIASDGYVDITLDFPDFFASSGEWFILPQVLRALTSQVVRFHVFGYLRTPRARPRWRFQDDPSRLPIDPIPPRLQRLTAKRF